MKNYLFLALAAALMMAVACSEPLNEAAEEATPQNEGTETPKKSHWGNKEPIPYTIPNMHLALDKLQSDGLSKSALSKADIKPTHVYLKFFPSDLDELDLLKDDSVLCVVPVPYDYDLEGFDGSYHDPEVPAEIPTYQYSVVEVGHPLPNVRYEVLDSLYMPDLVEYKALSKSHSNVIAIWPELECEAIRLSGFDTTYTIDANRTLSKSYKPGGSVMSYDNVIENYDRSKWNCLFAVPNVRIHVNFSTHRRNGYTDINGNFKTDGNFRNKVHVHVYFDNSNYSIYQDNSNDVVAYYYGRVKSSNMPIQFKSNKTDLIKCSALARAAYWSFNKRRLLTAPKCARLRLFVNGHIDPLSQGTYDNGESTVKVYAQGMKTQHIAGATIAQLAKSMLCNAAGVYTYNSMSVSLKESWGIGVCDILTEDMYYYYLKRCDGVLKKDEKYEYTFPYQSSVYTHAVSDVVKQLSVFPLWKIENCTKRSKSLQELCNNLKNANSNYSARLDQIFKYWETYN